uniref:leucine-rich repeat-containing protein 2-like n=1 Tax=Myxine glutinosa TaxID=7769 RepID=UPI00358DEB43
MVICVPPGMKGFRDMTSTVASLKSFWETRIKKQKEKQKKEKERVEQSAIEKLRVEWYARLTDSDVRRRITQESGRLILRVINEEWRVLPAALMASPGLDEVYVRQTAVSSLPTFIGLFQRLSILDLARNRLTSLPSHIGQLVQLKQLDLSFNHLSSLPSELGQLKNLERMDLSSNNSLSTLPYQLGKLQMLEFLDLSSNRFQSIPVAALRMVALQWFDVSDNQLQELPQDIDRLQSLDSLLLQRNPLRYLPLALCHMPHLRAVVVSARSLEQVPTDLYSIAGLKLVTLEDGMQKVSSGDEEDLSGTKSCSRQLHCSSPRPLPTFCAASSLQRVKEVDVEWEQASKQFMMSYVKDLHRRDSAPICTAVVSFDLTLEQP